MNADRKVIIELRKRKASEKEGSLFIRISVGGKKPYERESLGYVIPEKFWDAEGERIIKGFPNYEAINRQITERRDEVKDAVTALIKAKKPLTNEVAIKILGGEDGDIIQFWEDYMAYLEQPRKSKEGEATKFKPNYIRKLRSELNRLTEFTGGSCAFSEINKKWLESYEVYCLPTLDAQTSLATSFSKLKSVLNRAADDGLFSFSQVKGFLWPRYIDPERPYLTLEQTEQIGERIYSGEWDSAPVIQACAAYFLIECYCGIRFSDWGRFITEKLIQSNALKVRAKKNGQPVYFPLSNSPRLSRIIAYIQENGLVPPKSEQVANRQLKHIGALIGLPFELTTHTGRHTCAVLLLEMGYSEAAIAEILGISIRTVAIYAKMTRRKLIMEYTRFGGL